MVNQFNGCFSLMACRAELLSCFFEEPWLFGVSDKPSSGLGLLTLFDEVAVFNSFIDGILKRSTRSPVLQLVILLDDSCNSWLTSWAQALCYSG